MTGHDLLDTLGDIDARFLRNEADMQAKNDGKYMWLAVAATLLVIAGGVYVVSRFVLPGRQEAKATAAVTYTAPSETTNTVPTSSTNAPDSKEQGVYVPEIILPESEEKGALVMRDMVGLVVYKGGIYTQAEYYGEQDLDKVADLIGERLGTAKGNLDEWSSQDEYATEFASNMAGGVYTVKGYDPDFRICVCIHGYTDQLTMVMFMERMNNITLSKGEDIFENRLHIYGNVKSVQKQSQDDWNNGRGNRSDVSISDEVWDAFWKSTNEAPVVDTWSDVIEAEKWYREGKIVHLYLQMEDGTVNHIRLKEGGYVGYMITQDSFWVKIPLDVFNQVFEKVQ